jgi:hypothetical protein
MFRIRRDGGGGTRFLALRIGLFGLAVGVWLAGVWAERQWVTAAAIVVLIAVVLLGLVARKDDS